MTNCSFYDSFGPGEMGSRVEEGSLVGSHTMGRGESIERENIGPTNLKLTMMKSDLCDVIQENNSNSQTTYQFPKSEFGSCGSQGETGDSLLDNLLTEIAQA
jgi:hypothetical protein